MSILIAHAANSNATMYPCVAITSPEALGNTVSVAMLPFAGFVAETMTINMIAPTVEIMTVTMNQFAPSVVGTQGPPPPTWIHKYREIAAPKVLVALEPGSGLANGVQVSQQVPFEVAALIYPLPPPSVSS